MDHFAACSSSSCFITNESCSPVFKLLFFMCYFNCVVTIPLKPSFFFLFIFLRSLSPDFLHVYCISISDARFCCCNSFLSGCSLSFLFIFSFVFPFFLHFFLLRNSMIILSSTRIRFCFKIQKDLFFYGKTLTVLGKKEQEQKSRLYLWFMEIITFQWKMFSIFCIFFRMPIK